MQYNVPLLRKTLEHIETNPQEWEQKVWHCGTSGCFAWHAAMLDGAEPVTSYPDSSYVLATEDDPPSDLSSYEGVVHVAVRAARVLGLGDQDRSRLFHYTHTLDDLRRIVAELIAREER